VSRSLGRRPTLVGLVVAIATLAVPAVASAKASTSVVLGPIKVKQGFTVTIDVSCGAKGANTTVDYIKGTESNGDDHFYSGSGGKCSASGSLGKSSLAVNWPGLLTAKVHVAKAGKLSKNAKAPAGCRGGKGSTRAVEFGGSVSSEIHSSAFGAVKLRKVAGVIYRATGLSCKPAKLAKGINLNATWDTSTVFLNAAKTLKGKQGSVLISAADNPGPGVTGDMDVTITGKKVFTAAADLSSAQITGVTGLATGSLSWTSLPACAGVTGSLAGGFSGTLTVTDPVLGNIALAGGQESYGVITTGNGDPGSCHGSGSATPTPSVTNVCNQDQTCSVQYGTNADTFYDLTSGLVGSETVTPFAGGPALPITPNGSVSYTYTTPGDYTATLTVTAANGTTYTATTPVYIDS
jgi:hypothetical protein